MLNSEAFPGSNTCAAIVVAAGGGSRMAEKGLPPKQFRMLAGKPVLLWSLEALLRCERIRDVVVVAPETDLTRTEALIAPLDDLRLRVVAGGATRTDSVRNGLAALSSHAQGEVLIHDAARPGLSLAVIEELLAALDTHDAAAPALAMTDAVKLQAAGAVTSVSRDGLMRVQTPQAFRFETIRSAYAHATGAAVDDLALVEAQGARITLTRGRPELAKITHPEDMPTLAKLIATPNLRIGNGFDVHGFEAGDAVILCGVRIPHAKKLQGHSDADAGWHALTDAILGAMSLGDIGDHFPPSDARWKGQDSRTFLVAAVRMAAERGFSIVNADITLLCEKPKIAPHRDAMRARTAEALEIDIDRVSIKATTTEKLGFLGREEGIAAQAVVLLSGA